MCKLLISAVEWEIMKSHERRFLYPLTPNNDIDNIINFKTKRCVQEMVQERQDSNKLYPKIGKRKSVTVNRQVKKKIVNMCCLYKMVKIVSTLVWNKLSDYFLHLQTLNMESKDIRFTKCGIVENLKHMWSCEFFFLYLKIWSDIKSKHRNNQNVSECN